MMKSLSRHAWAATVLMLVSCTALPLYAAPAAPPVPPPPGLAGPPSIPAPAGDAPAAAPEAAAVAAAPAAPATEKWAGSVIQLQSADRLTVDHGGVKTDIRLYGVDAPEPGQKEADEAKKLVTDAVTGQTVNVEVLTQDNLGVSVAVVTLADGRNLSHGLLESGLAWWDIGNVPEDRELKKLHATAIAAGKGIWADPAPLAPWDFRGSHGGEQFKYRVKAAEETAPAAEKKEEPKKEEVKKVSAKGNEEYIGTFSIPPNAKLPDNVDPNQLLIQHMPSIAKDASGNSIGMSIPDISGIPFATQLGFKDGDVISSVNGVPLQDPSQIMALAPQFKDTKQFNVQVIRGGKPMNLTINVP